MRVVGVVSVYSALLAGVAWAALAVTFADSGLWPRYVRGGLVAVGFAAVLFLVRPRPVAMLACAGLCVTVMLWFFSLSPKNDREWAPEVAHCPTAQIDGNRLIVRNVRNFDYRSKSDFTPHWEERTYDLDKLRTADIMLCHWGSDSIAHAMVSFVFDGDQYLCASIETRREKPETYSAVQGFFRQYELIYIFADERDLVRLRTNFRNEDVYLYRTTVNPEEARRLLLSYLKHANSLAEHPEFYNALTSNCVTNVVASAREINPSARITWQILLSGHAARQAYQNGRLYTGVPFETLRQMSRVNDKALAAPDDSAFSQRIREGLPVPGN